MTGNRNHAIAEAKRRRLIGLIRSGMSIRDALLSIGSSQSAYSKWRQNSPSFCAEVDAACGRGEVKSFGEDMTRQEFALKYFGMGYPRHLMRFANEYDATPPGHIVLVLFPPAHGKTTCFENLATEDIARNNQMRITVASEGLRISEKIVGRVRNRLEPSGPCRALVRDFGPFKAQAGMSREQTITQAWSNKTFNVIGKATLGDERDFNMQALGRNSSIVSTRCDRLHLDDLQSLKTYGESAKLEEWVRQDALSRPGVTGKTTIAGTRVGEGDVYERLMEDRELDDIMRVVRLPAIVTNPDTNELEPLWPKQHPLDPFGFTMEQLDQLRRTVGPEAWDRNYMQSPGQSRRTQHFDQELLTRCHDPELTFRHTPQDRPIMYISLDPALDKGLNCIIAVSIHPDKMVVRWIRERSGLMDNEEIMAEVATVVEKFKHDYHITDLIIESMNFQRGLARDERLRQMRDFYGFSIREHLTGHNKYDPDIGVPSMATSFRKREIVLPFGDDDLTRFEIEQLERQFKAWRPTRIGGVTVARGNKLRQDRVMALWFAYILWQSRWKSSAPPTETAASFKRAVPSSLGFRFGPVMPVSGH